ncbi:Multidrug resistance protein ABC transporter [Phytophthora megakarya]|uniref:Multidrug resistance protein ABC transporter n=1 Tax=Phytophthora megakarya TaxID=4795 RepID=A0A225V278_9STRA|nr:Multidrug resistance protein ABC transporter [Phytophthora megakarya]
MLYHLHEKRFRKEIPRLDLKALPNGYSTEIGERGINLSGDDPLSAVDPHVAHAIFEKCIVGMASDQTRLLVLNSHYDLLPRANHVIVMDDGVITAVGTYSDVVAQFPHLGSNNRSMVDMAIEPSVVRTNVDRWSETNENVKIAKSVKTPEDEENDSTAAGQLVQSEDRVRGTVSTQVYKTYFDDSGFNGVIVFVVLVLVYCIGQASRTVVDWWPGHWARSLKPHANDTTYSSLDLGMLYLGLIVLCSVLTMIRALLMIESCVRTSQNLHDELFRRLLNAPITLMQDPAYVMDGIFDGYNFLTKTIEDVIDANHCNIKK